MTLYYLNVGNPPHRQYYIETERHEPIADYDNLYTAAVVLRYLKGGLLDLEERAHARAALIAFDRAKGGEPS